MGATFQRVDKKRWPGIYYYESENRKFRGKPELCYRISYKIDGKKIWEKIGWQSEGITPQLCAEIRADRLRTARLGDAVKTAKDLRQEKSEKDRKLDEIADTYFAQRGGSAQAGHFDRLRYDKHVSPALGGRKVSSLSPLDVQRIKSAMTGYAPATVWGALELVRRIANFGHKVGLSPKLGFVIDMPKRNNEVVEYLEPEQAGRLIEVLNSWPNQDAARMIKLAMFSGMRRGEIFKLEEKDLDFLQGLIKLRNPKGGVDAVIPINKISEDILREQLQSRDKAGKRGPFVFPGKDGQRKFSTAPKRIKAAAGLPEKFRIFHGLRHHYAVALANSGQFSLDMIGELLTHKSSDMTRRYAQFLPGTLKKAGELAGNVVAEQATQKEEN